jgi:hypothetical protein
MQQPFITFRLFKREIRAIATLSISVFAAVPLHAAVIVQSVYVDMLQTSESYDSADSFDPNGGGIGITIGLGGLDKFDPALGTLNQILIKPGSSMGVAPYLYHYSEAQITINSAGMIDFEVTPPFPADGGIYYLPSNSNFITSVSVIESDFYSYYSEFADAGDDILFLTDEGLDLPESGNVMEISGFFADDFVGTGEVTALEYGVFLPQSVEFTVVSSNIDFLEVFVQLELEAGYMDVEYHYTPVPEPRASAFIAALGALWLCRRRALQRIT